LIIRTRMIISCQMPFIQPMKRKIEQEQVLEVLEELRGRILIVEGKKDERALRGLGIRRIIRVDSRPIERVVRDAVLAAEKHKNREIIVLTDFDRTGRKLAAKMRLILQSRKIHANSRVRRDVMNLGIKCVEELASVRGAAPEEHGGPGVAAGRRAFVSRKSKFRESDDYGETCANFNEVRGKGLHKGKRDNRKAGRDRGDIRAD
jgi:5S rRNA maturation endonuclease (ribonuclease M5)